MSCFINKYIHILKYKTTYTEKYKPQLIPFLFAHLLIELQTDLLGFNVILCRFGGVSNSENKTMGRRAKCSIFV